MMIKFVFGILLLHLSSSSVAAQSNYSAYGFKADPSDLYAMKQLWYAWNTTPEVQKNLAGWNPLVDESMPPCDPESPWRGVFCNARSNPTKSAGADTVWDLAIDSLNLQNVSLSGIVPPGIGNLSNLVTLSLTNNPELTGVLPKEMENLYSLYDLDLHGNGITGGFPNWKHDSFVFLQSINLGDNKMTGGLPANQTNSFRAMQTLNFSHNLFSGPSYLDLFNYLQKAVAVDVSHNEFSGALPNFVNFTADGTFYAVTNPLSYADFSSNKISGPLPKLSGHQTIQFFNVSRNLLTGELDPALLSNIPLLATMDLSSNQFTGFIPNLDTLKSLGHLDLSYNNFNPEPFPSWTTNLDSLQILTLRGVSLTGDVPSSILVRFRSLHTLALDDNNLTGTLDIDSMHAVPNGSRSLKLVSLTNNKIENVAYTGRIVNLSIKFNLLGNPYCDNSTSADNDMTRCVCQQQCSDTPGAPSNKKVIIIATVTCASILALVLLVSGLLFWRGRKERYALILGAEQKFAEYEVKPTIYTYSELQLITRFFSIKLGQGAFGAVYKGNLPNGSEVAVKQLFTKSQQSLDDFLNEIVLVAAVKHRNLVKLKGCCIRKDQRLLVHEYVENGDLEQFLFGQEDVGKKDWSVHKNICYEIAEGIHYLHFATQPKIIHRDIKACNILLDKNLEPKIADFGLALLYPDEDTHIMTIHVAGTRGYLAPEYAHLGQLSEKVDVFSYGVLLLEIVSRRRNMGPRTADGQFYLPAWAWTLHSEGRIKELIAPNLELQPREEIEAIRIINVALLCVHMSGERRPDMKDVVVMLHGGMDTEVARLLEEHANERFPSSRDSRSHGDGDSSSGLNSWVSRDESLAPSVSTATSVAAHNSLTPFKVENGKPSEMWVEVDKSADKSENNLAGVQEGEV
ncbi:hypothetical protein KC19_3G227000 [Ceratodon purpureus]|uniref:Protein kinase domain-containing protein n=1 Tax=Ceratodon purpureus TaxID=3225 RepID=A0A8T0IQK7_CERPU|nr:hypothetical protein KC19_3G227000 [Ceratodon purpureus]